MSFRICIYDKAPELRNAFAKLIEAAKSITRPQINSTAVEVLDFNPHVPFRKVIEQNGIDAIVSPGNSYGFLNGGFDAAISKYYAAVANVSQDDVTISLQRVLKEKVGGYNPPTNAIIVDMAAALSRPNLPHLIHVPTMSLPHLIPSGSPTVFNCAWNVLNAVKVHNDSITRCEGLIPIDSILMPGLGTGVGGVQSACSAKQVMTAYELFSHPLQEEYDMRGGMSMGIAAAVETMIEKCAR